MYPVFTHLKDIGLMTTIEKKQTFIPRPIPQAYVSIIGCADQYVTGLVETN